MSITTRTVDYTHDGKTFEAFVAVDSATQGPRPVVLVGHSMMENRGELLARINAAVALAKAQPEADTGRVAVIGYCFGGLCALDLARSGANVRGVVSFHGLLKPNGLPAKPIKAKALVLHGADDPMAPIEDVVAFRKEFTEGGSDWQLHLYGHTQHAFSVPGANIADLGIKHNADAERRSAVSERDFLKEVLA